MSDHLKPYQWKPGQSGNPSGPKKRKKLSTILRDLMEQTTKDGRLVGDAFVVAVIEHAVRDGNPALIREIFDRHDGKLVDKVKAQQTSEQTIRVQYDDNDADDDPLAPPPRPAEGGDPGGEPV